MNDLINRQDVIDAYNLAITQPQIIRCKDCKNWERDAIFDEGWCRWKQQGEPNWFCADGERRENE